MIQRAGPMICIRIFVRARSDDAANLLCQADMPASAPGTCDSAKLFRTIRIAPTRGVRAMGQVFPNESREYRDARDRLLEEERALVDKVAAVAELRRKLPRGGALKEDYVLEWAKDGKLGEPVKISELFGG